MMISVICSHDQKHLPAPSDGVVPVVLYGQADKVGMGQIGIQFRHAFYTLPSLPRKEAIDLLSVALSVIAADTFVMRDTACDRWHRNIKLTVRLASPDGWKNLEPQLERALNFLTGDHWQFEFLDDGFSPTPIKYPKVNADSVCLLSGGLDSATGLINLISKKGRPLLVSQAYRGDRKYQDYLLFLLNSELPRYVANADPKFQQPKTGPRFPYESSMRARSLLFLAMATLAASAIAQQKGSGQITVHMPENGFISINPPLTPRRIGSHSTRTTHPHFLSIIQEIIAGLGIPVQLENPFRGLAKGQILTDCLDPQLLRKIVHHTVSCGKWKRSNQQCGRCVPCLVRRAALFEVGIKEKADSYRFADLSLALGSENDRDDLLAILLAIENHLDFDLRRWATRNGPLPINKLERQTRIEAVKSGLQELQNFLKAQGCIP